MAGSSEEASTRIRVRYCECDPMGVAHHATYAPWLEIGRTEMLRGMGMTYAEMERSGVYLVVARMEIRYRRPIFYDDLVEVRTRVSGGGRVKIEHEYELMLVEPGTGGVEKRGRAAGELLSSASTTLVCVDREGVVRPLPDLIVPRT